MEENQDSKSFEELHVCMLISIMCIHHLFRCLHMQHHATRQTGNSCRGSGASAGIQQVEIPEEILRFPSMTAQLDGFNGKSIHISKNHMDDLQGVT